MADSAPLVSVLIPVYNATSYIAETLAAVRAQTYPHLEVIVADDGSTDDTAEVVEAIAAQDPRVQLVRQPNRGVAHARNLALSRARGAFVAPLDADDLWYPEKLATQVARLRQGGDAMGMVYSWWVAVDEAGRIRGSSFPTRLEGDLFLDLVFSNFICASDPLIRRSAALAVGGWDATLRDRGGQGCEDWDLWLRLANRYAIGCAPGFFVAYRSVPGSMSKQTDSMARSYALVIEQAKALRSIPAPVLRWGAGAFAGYLASTSYAGGRYRDALRWLWWMIKEDPATLGSRHPFRIGGRSLASELSRTLGRWGLKGVERRLAEYQERGRAELPVYTLGEIERNWEGEARPAAWVERRRPFGWLQERRWRRMRTPARAAAGPEPVAESAAAAEPVEVEPLLWAAP